MNEPRCVQQANSILGESPSWSQAEQRLYWVDIYRPAVFCFDPLTGQTKHWPLEKPVGCVVPTALGDLVLAGTGGVQTLNSVTGELSLVCNPEAQVPHNRFNDGKVDRRGRLWAGTLNEEFTEGAGSLYRIDPDGSALRMDVGFTCSNGIGWSPDDRIMYFTDSRTHTIWCYDYELSDGTISNRRVFAKLKPSDGDPDGLTVDAEGCIWSAIWDGWRLMRFFPDGSIDRIVAMPVQRPTSCMFGGPELKTLFVTSAAYQLSWDTLKSCPLSGGLFALETEVAGLPEVPFGGQAKSPF